jgi:DNA-binding HxlR family transcriptional regulator
VALSSVPGEPEGVGAGSSALLLFADPLSAKILRAHVAGPLRPSALYREVGWSAQTTMRTSVSNLETAGALVKHQIGGSPYAVENELTVAGQEMLMVSAAIDVWLSIAPAGPIAPDSNAAKVAIKALAGGWGSAVIQALATQPHSLAELDVAIPALSYPLLKRRLSGLRLSQQIEPVVGSSGRAPNPYAATEWLRHAIAPLVVAARCERRHMEETTTAMSDVELETAMMLTVPLALLPVGGADGTCTLGVEVTAGVAALAGAKLDGVTVGVVAGQIATCVAQVDHGWPGWALGTAQTWLDVFIDGQVGTALRLSRSDPQPVTDLVDGVHRALFQGSSAAIRGVRTD